MSRLPFDGAGYLIGAYVRGVNLIENRLNEERLTVGHIAPTADGTIHTAFSAQDKGWVPPTLRQLDDVGSWEFDPSGVAPSFDSRVLRDQDTESAPQKTPTAAQRRMTPRLPSTCDSLKAGQFSLGFGAGGRLPIWHGVGGFMFNSSSSSFSYIRGLLITLLRPTSRRGLCEWARAVGSAAPKPPTLCSRHKLGRGPWLLICTWGSAQTRDLAIPGKTSSITRVKRMGMCGTPRRSRGARCGVTVVRAMRYALCLS